MPSVADLKEQLKNQLADFDSKVKELNASKPNKAKERESWLKDRQKEINEIKATNSRDLGGFDKDTNAEKASRQKDINSIKNAADKKAAQDDYNRWLQQRTAERAELVKQQQAEIASKNNEIKQYNTDYTNWIKDIDAQIAQANKDKSTTNADINKAIQQRGVVEAQSKKLGIEPDEYEQFLANKDQYQQLKQEYKPYLSQLAENKTRDAAIAEIAKAQKIDPSILKNYFQSKEVEPLYTSATRAQEEAEAQAAAQAKADQESAAARQAQMQQYAQEAAQIAQKRKTENYAQMYNLLTQNMPAPVGYGQPATSQQALTTMINADGEDQGIMGGQMSPAQIAQMGQGIIPQGVPLPPQFMQQLAQQQAAQQQSPAPAQAPTPAKRGGIMGRY